MTAAQPATNARSHIEGISSRMPIKTAKIKMPRTRTLSRLTVSCDDAFFMNVPGNYSAPPMSEEVTEMTSSMVVSPFITLCQP